MKKIADDLELVPRSPISHLKKVVLTNIETKGLVIFVDFFR